MKLQRSSLPQLILKEMKINILAKAIMACVVSLGAISHVWAFDPAEIPILKIVLPDFVTNYADYGPIDLPVILCLNVQAASPWRLNGDGTAKGGFCGGGPSSFYTYALAGYVGVHVGTFHGTLSIDGTGGGKPPEWNGVAKDVVMFIGDEAHNYISDKNPIQLEKKLHSHLIPHLKNLRISCGILAERLLRITPKLLRREPSHPWPLQTSVRIQSRSIAMRVGRETSAYRIPFAANRVQGNGPLMFWPPS